MQVQRIESSCNTINTKKNLTFNANLYLNICDEKFISKKILSKYKQIAKKIGTDRDTIEITLQDKSSKKGHKNPNWFDYLLKVNMRENYSNDENIAGTTFFINDEQILKREISEKLSEGLDILRKKYLNVK